MKSTIFFRRILYICTLLCALLGQLFDIGWIFHYIFFCVLSLPVLSLLLSLPGILGLRLHLSASSREAPRTTHAAWSLTADSRFGLPVSCVTGRVKLCCPFTGEKDSFPFTLRGVPSGAPAAWELDTTHCGRIECTVVRLRAWDCLGLFSLPLRRPPPGALLIVPLPEPPLRLILPDSSGSTALAPGNKAAAGEEYELRPFREGDNLHTVHWKMSAKRDELVVRERLAGNYPLPVLTFDHFGTLDELDRVLDRLAGYSRALLDQERPHAVRWANPLTGEIRQYGVSCQRDWSVCLTAILEDPAPAEGKRTGAVGGGLAYQIHITGESPCPDI